MFNQTIHAASHGARPGIRPQETLRVGPETTRRIEVIAYLQSGLIGCRIEKLVSVLSWESQTSMASLFPYLIQTLKGLTVMVKKFACSLIRQALTTKFPFLLAHALKNFQVTGFNSILLAKSDDLVLRLYVCKPGESQLRNSLDQNDNTLMIHNHRFFFQSEVVVGWMANLLYTESEMATAHGEWFKYGYSSALMNSDGRMHLVPEGKVHLSLDAVQYVYEGDFYEMQPEQLHKIMVPNDRMVIILFWEHAKVQIDQKLYSRYALPESPSTEGLNQRFSSGELRDLLNLVLEAL